MKPLSQEAEDRAVASLRNSASKYLRHSPEYVPAERKDHAPAYARADGKTFDEAQARLDLRAFPDLLAGVFERRRADKRLTVERLLAEAAAEFYLEHTGKGPSSTDNRKLGLPSGGLFPAFICILAEDLGIPFDKKKLPGACREAKRALKGDLSVLKFHIVGYENDEGEFVDNRDPDHDDPVFGGYEPASDRSRPAFEAFKEYLAKVGYKG